MMIALLNVISVCPLLASSMPETSSCCDHSKGHQLPCTESTGHNCPYVLLEKAKGEQVQIVFALTAIVTSAAANFNPRYQVSSLTHAGYYKDSSSSYLLLRVLRI